MGKSGEKWGISQSVFPITHKINSPFFPIFYGIFVKNLPLRWSLSSTVHVGKLLSVNALEKLYPYVAIWVSGIYIFNTT